MKEPSKSIICTCNQCKGVKNKRKNRKQKKRIHRWLKRSAKQANGKIINFFWA